MNSHQEDKYGMYLKTDLFLVANALALAFNPAIAAARTVLNSFINAIAQADSTATRNITGFTEAKNEQRKQQLDLFKKVRAGMMGYFVGNPNPGKESIVNYTDTQIDDFRDAELFIRSSQLLDLALPVKTDLVPFGVDDTDVDALKTLNDAWPSIEPSARLEEGVNKAAGEDVDRIMADTDQHLKKPLDVYMKVVQYNNTNLYSRYQTARMIDDSGGGSDSTGYDVSTYTVPTGSSIIFKTVPLAEIPADLNIYLRAVNGGIIMCTTDLPANPCSSGFNLVQGNTFKGEFQNLGIDRTKLNIQFTNPGLSDVVVRAGFKKE